MDNIYSILLPPPTNVVPAIILNLNAGYFLDVETTTWQANRATFPALAEQYRVLIDLVVADATSRGVVVVLDLRWNDDISQFSETALKGTSTSGDSNTFWTQLATKYASNPFVFYQLFGAPHIDSFSTWLEGNSIFAGMRTLLNTVVSKNIQGMILVGGQRGFAYDDVSLIQFNSEFSLNTIAKVIYVFKPFQGPGGLGLDQAKSLQGFIVRADNVISSTKRPIYLSEIGQFCCPANGACFQHDGVRDGITMGYTEAILTEATLRNISWAGFGYRPGVGGDCLQPDMNDNGTLYSSDLHSGLGTDWKTLFPQIYKGIVRLGNGGNNDPAVFDITGPVAGGSVGGAVGLFLLIAVFKRHHSRSQIKKEVDSWTNLEIRALQEKYQVTHDFEELCKTVPHRSRQSVALRAKSFQTKTKSTFLKTFSAHASFIPSERFAFLSPKLRIAKPTDIPFAKVSDTKSSLNLPPGNPTTSIGFPSPVNLTPSIGFPSQNYSGTYFGNQEATNPSFHVSNVSY